MYSCLSEFFCLADLLTSSSMMRCGLAAALSMSIFDLEIFTTVVVGLTIIYPVFIFAGWPGIIFLSWPDFIMAIVGSLFLGDLRKPANG